VKKGEMYGYIDHNGKEIITCQFEQAGPFTEGRAAIQKNGWVGFIDTSGTMVIEPKFTCSVSHPIFVNGMAPVFGADEMTGYISPDGSWKIEPKFHSASRFVDGKAWAMIKKDDPAAPYALLSVAAILIPRENCHPPQYDFGWDFSDGYATVWKLTDDRRTKLWYVLDPSGQEILRDLTYRNVGAMSSD
jgi:hypothetical protein